MDIDWAVERIMHEVGDLDGAFVADAKLRRELRNRTRAVLREWSGLGETAAKPRHITILLSDIRGFTAIAETLPAMAVVDMLNRYFDCMCQIITRYRGTIDKFMGDSILVLFGAPTSAADDVERALACAVEMQLAMTEFNATNEAMGLPALYVGIGINTGHVVAGPLGPDAHTEYTAIGDEVNLTSRIEAQSLRGQILIGANTWELARDFIEVGPVHDVQVKGKRQSVQFYELLATRRPRELQVPRREVRSSPRVPVRLPMSFQCLEENKGVDAQQWQGEVVDIGYNGLLVVLPIALPVRSEIMIHMSLGLFEARQTSIYARILQRHPSDSGMLCSVEFSFIEAPAAAAIKEYVDTQMNALK
jgi:adenylate cyclase